MNTKCNLECAKKGFLLEMSAPGARDAGVAGLVGCKDGGGRQAHSQGIYEQKQLRCSILWKLKNTRKWILPWQSQKL